MPSVDHSEQYSACELLADLPSLTAYAQEVESALFAGTLRLTDRHKLLNRASHFGLSRFDANVIVALVQERADIREPFEMRDSAPAARRWFTPAVIAILSLQAVIGLFVWRMLS